MCTHVHGCPVESEIAINRAKDDELVDVSAQRDTHGEEVALDDDVLAAVSQAYRTRPGQESHVLGHEVQRAMQTLQPQVRKAVILVHVLGYEVESNDPGKITAATLCDVRFARS